MLSASFDRVRVRVEIVRYLRALAVGLASGLVVLWFESLTLLGFELHGWTAAYLVNGRFLLLSSLGAFAIGFCATVSRGRR